MGDYALSYKNFVLSTYEILSILDLKLTKNINEHGQLYLTAVMPEKGAEDYVYTTTTMTPVTLSYYTEEQNLEIFFRGTVSNIQIRREGNVYYMDLCVNGNTYAMDVIRRSRSFQNTSMTLHQLVKEVMSKYPNSDYIISIPDEPLGRLVMQYQETDWEFLQRIVSHYGAVLIPDVRAEKMAFFIGVPNQGESYNIEPYQYCVYKMLDEYRRIKENRWADVKESDFTVFQIQDYGVFQVGEGVKLSGKNLVIQSAYHILRDGILKNVYELKSKKGLKGLESYNTQIVGASISGKVVDVSRDKVKVDLQIDEPGRANYWFPYSTMSASPDGSGWYCMPEKGDEVRVYFPTNEEKDAYAVSAVSGHQPAEGDTKDPMSNPNVKYLRTQANQEIQFAEDGIIINSGNGQASIFLGKSGELSVYGKTNVNVTAEKTLSLVSKGQLLIGATNSITLKKGEGTSIVLDSNGDIKLSGNKIYSN